MAELNFNIIDTKDLITQSKNLTREQKKEAQIARMYLNQLQMPYSCGGSTGKFMMDNLGFKSETMGEAAFRTGLSRAGQRVGINESDILETYEKYAADEKVGEFESPRKNEAIIMALCNHIYKETAAVYETKSPEQINAYANMIQKNVKLFGDLARGARVNLGVILVVEQQMKNDLAKLSEMAKTKEEMAYQSE